VPRPLPGTVKALGAVSLLTDVSSEMIYPLLGAFVTGTLRAGPALLGVIEGLAEATASLVKLGSGRLSDRLPRRKPLVVLGYSLSSLARPLVGFARAPSHVLLVRLADRVGKGTRGAPRDAIVAEVVRPDERGRAYGFHRALDNAGACLGPLLAAALLALGLELRAVFWAAALPGLVSVCVLIAGVSEPPPAPVAAPRPSPGGTGSMPSLAAYLVVLALFTLGNSSDAFLLLRAQQAGVGLGSIPLLWMLHNGVKAATGTPLGALSDRFGRRRTIALGWGVYALAYAGFAFASGATQVTLVFAFYALFHALSEGPERALVADLAGAARSGAAFGAYHAVTGAMLLPASVLCGWLWQRFGATTALLTGAGLAAAAAGGLLIFVSERVRA
jgi:MFS family permease